MGRMTDCRHEAACRLYQVAVIAASSLLLEALCVGGVIDKVTMRRRT